MQNNIINYNLNVDEAKHHTCRVQPYTKSRPSKSKHKFKRHESFNEGNNSVDKDIESQQVLNKVNHRYLKTNKESAPRADFNTQNLLIEMQGLHIEYEDNIKLNSEDTNIHSNVGKLTGKIQQLNIVEDENPKENNASYLNIDQPNTRRPRYIKYQDKCFQCRKTFDVFFNNDYGELQFCDAVLKHGNCYHETCAT